MDDKRLDKIRERCEKATPGPWMSRSFKGERDIPCFEVYSPCPCCGLVAETVPICGEGDAEFIAHVREDVPYLLDEITRLTAESEALREELKNARTVPTVEPLEPLTLEELREMDGEPIYCVVLKSGKGEWAIDRIIGVKIGVKESWLMGTSGARFSYGKNDYGEAWLAFRQKPTEG